MYYKPIIIPIQIKSEEEVFQEVAEELKEEVVGIIKDDYNEFDNGEIELDEYLERVVEIKELKDTVNEIIETKDMIIK